jgi:hypothetical protein
MGGDVLLFGVPCSLSGVNFPGIIDSNRQVADRDAENTWSIDLRNVDNPLGAPSWRCRRNTGFPTLASACMSPRAWAICNWPNEYFAPGMGRSSDFSEVIIKNMPESGPPL